MFSPALRFNQHTNLSLRDGANSLVVVKQLLCKFTYHQSCSGAFHSTPPLRGELIEKIDILVLFRSLRAFLKSRDLAVFTFTTPLFVLELR